MRRLGIVLGGLGAAAGAIGGFFVAMDARTSAGGLRCRWLATGLWLPAPLGGYSHPRLDLGWIFRAAHGTGISQGGWPVSGQSS